MFRNLTSRYMSPTISTFDVNVGSFGANTSTGNQVVAHGLASTPKVILFFAGTPTTDDAGEGSVFVLGAGISSTERSSVGTWGNHNSNPVVYNQSQQKTKCIYFPSTADAADLVSIDGTNFTINWTNAPVTAIIINFIALGGDALTGYKLGTFTAKTSTGNQSYTGVGFQPDVLLTFAGKWSTPEEFDVSANGTGLISLARSSSERGYVAWRGKNNVATALTRHRQSKIKVAGSLTDSGIFTEADFVSMDADGFTWNYTTAGGGADYAYYLALKGPQFKVGSILQPTSTGIQSTSVGFQPKGLILVSANDIAANNDATNNDFGISFGTASASNKRGCIWWGDANGVSPSVAQHVTDRTKIVKFLSIANPPTLNAAADLNAFTSSGFDLNWTTVDATQRELLYLAMG